MIYIIEIYKNSNKIIYNAYKKDQMGVEYACADDLPSEEAAIDLIRNKWQHKGRIKVVGTGINGTLEQYSDIEGVL
jgi:N-acetylmuramic acid 6-phosphate (MurNAc-6-P) etherase